MEDGIVLPSHRIDDEIAAIQEYEREQFPRAEVDPVEAILFRMDQFDHKQADVARITGLARSHLSEVLNRKRKLNLDQVRRFNRYGIALDVLVRDYEL